MNDYIKALIKDMTDAGTLPRLSPEEVDDLTNKSIDGLVPYILEVFDY